MSSIRYSFRRILTSFQRVFHQHNAKKIFIIGSGRSGTHLIGQAIEAHPDVKATIEAQPAFGWVTRMALDPSTRQLLLPELILFYQHQHSMVVPHHYLDKSHPNIWIAEQLADLLPDALFVSILRNPYATVASMLKHDGVLEWHRKWRDFPVPNRFLGIDNHIATYYDHLPMATRCALRWRSHYHKLEELRETLGTRLIVINYEELCLQSERVIEKLQEFLALDGDIPLPEIQLASLEKWQKGLSSQQIAQIRNVIEHTDEELTSYLKVD